MVLDGTGLTTEAMQHFTDWTNLSECTFVLPPTPEGRAAGADYRVRIFCPGRELPFAGHPTLGTCHAWLQAGGQPRGEHVVQECGVGLVPIERDGARLAFAAPPLRRSGPLDEADVALIARGLGDCARRHRGARLVRQRPALARRDAAQRRPGAGAEARRHGAGRAGHRRRGSRAASGARRRRDTAFEVRAFFPRQHTA